MHEMTLAESVLQIVEDAVRREGLRRVRAVWLEIGQLSSVEPEAMRFCFDAIMHGTIAQGAQLEIIDVPGTGWCIQCAETVALPQRDSSCPRCHGYQVQPKQGMEMRVKELEVE